MNSSAAAEIANTTVLGFSFDTGAPVATFFEYTSLNVLICSVLPIPLASTMVGLAVLLYGMVLGMIINTSSLTLGCYLSLLLTRFACRPRLMRLLGRYQAKWEALDCAITQEGYQIALLIRLAPIAPLVLSNILLSMTSISQRTYVWTTAVGCLPANLPFAYVALVGKSMLEEFPPRDPVILILSFVGLRPVWQTAATLRASAAEAGHRAPVAPLARAHAPLRSHGPCSRADSALWG
jgi:uncharacterized membrane protein YdjX (TVP38/TMEM64 family)